MTKNRLKSIQERICNTWSHFLETEAQVHVECQNLFEAGCQELFAANPELKTFCWEQYLETSDDGQEFCVDTDYPGVNEKLPGANISYAVKGDADYQLSELQVTVSEFLTYCPIEFYQRRAADLDALVTVSLKPDGTLDIIEHAAHTKV